MTGWVRKALGLSPQFGSQRPRLPRKLALESLEERCVLSGNYSQTNLISDIPGLARFTDSNLSNPWSISFSQSGPFWLADNNAGVSTMYNGEGQAFPLNAPFAVTMGRTAGDPAQTDSPTGTVFNGGTGFVISKDGNSAPSRFLFATEEGTIFGWNPGVDITHALLAVDNSALPGAGVVYTGLAIATNTQGTFLYAANFRTGAIDIFDQNFQPVAVRGAFVDPNLPQGFVPFNIQAVGTSLYVTYTGKNGGRYDSGTGPGDGYVDLFDSQGKLLRRLVSQGPLDVPWGVAVAPGNFGDYSNDVLIGNFGDGRVNAFDSQSGAFLGPLLDPAGQPLFIPELWDLKFGNDANGGKSDTLYFTAGIGHEEHGLFGSLQPVAVGASTESTSAEQQRIAAIEDSSSDAYPLPPTQGPLLQQTPVAPEQLPVALSPLKGSAIALVPTLLAAEEGKAVNGAGASTSLPNGANLSGGTMVATAGATAMPSGMLASGTNHSAEQSDNSVSDLGNLEHSVDPSRADQKAAEIQLLVRREETVETATAWEQQALLGDEFGAASVSSAANMGITNPYASVGTEVAARETQFESYELLQQEKGNASTARATALGFFEWLPETPWQFALFLLAGLAAGCGGARQTLLNGTFIPSIKRFWTRTTRRPARTVVIASERVPANQLTTARLIEIKPA
jgi:uncharacterized protein (TIGR03118 family)